MFTNEEKSMTCIYCQAPQTENATICPTCKALIMLMNPHQQIYPAPCARAFPSSIPAWALPSPPPVPPSASLSTFPADASLSSLSPSTPYAAPGASSALSPQRITLPSIAQHPSSAIYPWPRLTLPTCEKKSQISWVQMYSRPAWATWWLPTPAPTQPGMQIANQRDAALLPTLPLHSLALSLPSRHVVAPHHLPTRAPYNESFPLSGLAAAVPSPAPASIHISAQDTLLLSTLPHTAEHDQLLLSTFTMPARRPRSPLPSAATPDNRAFSDIDTLPLLQSYPPEEPQPPARSRLHVPVMYTKPRAIIPPYRAICGLLSLLILLIALSVGVVYNASASGSLAALQRLINNTPDPSILSVTASPNWNALDKGPAYDTIPFAQTASRIDPDLAIATQPDKLFHTGQIFYITYSVQYPKTAGKVTIKWYVDNVLVQSLTSPNLPPARISNGYIAILYISPSHGTVELYWNDQLAQRLYFTVK